MTLDPDAAEALAAIHAAAFPGGAPRPWSAAEIAEAARAPGAALLVSGAPPEGFALVRTVAGEAELLTLAVRPEARRCGVGRRLLSRAEADAAARGALRLFLEVAEGNVAARALYAGAGFGVAGRRPRYFAGEDALVLVKDFS